MTLWKAFRIRREHGAPSSPIIQTFLREGMYYSAPSMLLIKRDKPLCHRFILLYFDFSRKPCRFLLLLYFSTVRLKSYMKGQRHFLSPVRSLQTPYIRKITI